MTREEFKTLVKGMKAVYAQPTFIPDQDLLKKQVPQQLPTLLCCVLAEQTVFTMNMV